MKLTVVLEPGEVVDDWDWFQEEFEAAAERLDIPITEIVHSRGES